MTEAEILRMNTTALAYLGDAVYELHIRNMILGRLPHDADRAHRAAIGYVSAEAQSSAARKLLNRDLLTETEKDLLRRARNRRSISKPRHAAARDYKLATGLEAVFGYLYLKQDFERIEALAAEAVRLTEQKQD